MKPEPTNPKDETTVVGSAHRIPDQDTPVVQPELVVTREKTTAAIGTARKNPLPQFPGYSTEAILGEGGMGIVYRARHLRLDRSVAIKTIHSGPSVSQDAVGRMLNEIDAIARLSHQHIVQIFDSGQLEGLPFYVMELIDGGNLSTRLASNPPGFRETGRLCELLARAIDHAHRNGIVHRDLKPSNILFTTGGEPKIADFGIAKRSGIERGLTATGMVIGTPGYLSPEQAEGKTNQITPASDIFSLGVILYEMLAGRQPFEGNSEVEVLSRIIHEDPPSPAWIRSGLPRDLETICLKCIQKKPARRYQTAAELADDLKRFAENQVIRARPTSRIERAVKWCRRQPAWATLIAAVAVVIPTVIAGLLWTNQRQARDLAQKNRLVANSSELSRYMIHEHLPQLYRLKGGSQLQYELALRLRTFLDSTYAESESDVGVLQELANSHEGVADVLGGPFGKHLGRISEAVESYRRTVRVWQSLYDRNPTDDVLASLLRCKFKLAESLWYAQGLAAAKDLLLELEPRIVELNADNPSRWQRFLVRLRNNQYEVAIAENDFPVAGLALDEFERCLGLPSGPDNEPEAFYNEYWLANKRSELASRQGNHEQARNHAREALALKRQMVAVDFENDDSRSQLAGALIVLADEESWLGEYDTAMELCLEADSIYGLIAANDLSDADAIEDLGMSQERISRIQFQLQRFDESIVSIQKAIEYLEKVNAIDPSNLFVHRKMVLGHTQLGDCYMQTGQLDKALQEQTNSLELFQALEKGDETELSDVQILAEIQNALGTVSLQLWISADPERPIDQALADPLRKTAEEHFLKSIAAWERISARGSFTDGQKRNHANTVKMLELTRQHAAQLEEMARQEIY